jgi:cytidine deaminase
VLSSLQPSGLTRESIADLRRSARLAAENAYAPYSRFRVGAALLLDGPIRDEIVTGCNVENGSYRLTTCAEQNAIASAVAVFGPKLQIRAMAIVNLNDAASAPCGACRQTINEFSVPETWVFFPGEEGALVESPIRDLLPSAFKLKGPNPVLTNMLP